MSPPPLAAGGLVAAGLGVPDFGGSDLLPPVGVVPFLLPPAGVVDLLVSLEFDFPLVLPVAPLTLAFLFVLITSRVVWLGFLTFEFLLALAGFSSGGARSVPSSSSLLLFSFLMVAGASLPCGFASLKI